MAQIDKVRLPDGRVMRPTEWSSTPLYSTVEIDDGAITPLQAFSYGLGGDVPGSVGPRKATEVDTNLQGDGSVLSENTELLLFSIMVEFFTHVDAADLAAFNLNLEAGAPPPPFISALNMGRIQRDTQLVMRIANTKRYMDHPVGFFPAAMGVAHTIGAADNGANLPFVVGGNGGPNVYDNREFATPHHVGGGEAFEITLEFPNGQVNALNLSGVANVRIRARIYCDGFRRRPVA